MSTQMSQVYNRSVGLLRNGQGDGRVNSQASDSRTPPQAKEPYGSVADSDGFGWQKFSDALNQNIW